MPEASDQREKLRAKMRALRQIEKKPNTISMQNIAKTLKRGKNVFLVFESSAERMKYQESILKEVSKHLDKEPVGGLPIGTLAGERVYAWDNGAEIAFATSIPRDPKGKLPLSNRPANTEFAAPEIPEAWKTTKN